MGKRVLSVKKAVIAVTAVISAGLVGSVVAAASTAANAGGMPGDPTVSYSSTTTVPSNEIESVGVEAYDFDELGNEVNLASSGTLSSVVVTMSSWACETGHWFDDTCSTTPGTTYTVPITLNIYNSATGSAPGPLIATDTQDFAIDFRPSADNVNCTGGERGMFFDPTAGTCVEGISQNITFSASNFVDSADMPVVPTLPTKVIYGIAYNTDLNGYVPLGGVDSPADSLNIGLSTAVSAGTNAVPDHLFMTQSASSPSLSELTCDPLVPGAFQSYNVVVITGNTGCGTGRYLFPAVQIDTGVPEETTTTMPATSTTMTATSTTMTATSTTMTATSTTVPVIPPSPGGSTTTTSSTTTTTRPSKPFPHANVSYPNGAIVTFGSAHYVFAGGRAFNASSSQLAAVQKVDPAKVLAAPAGAGAPTSVVPRPGVLVFTRPVNGNDTIYVVGTDGQLHGFATPSQFVHDGYDPALVVTVPNLGGLTTGSNAGTTLTALATKADGAIVNSSGTFYTFAGGKGFGIPTPAALQEIRKTNTAEELQGSVSAAETGAAIGSGVVLSVTGPVYVSYQGAAYPFKTMTQLANDGYGGTAAVPTPHTGGLTVVFPYSGS